MLFLHHLQKDTDPPRPVRSLPKTPIPSRPHLPHRHPTSDVICNQHCTRGRRRCGGETKLAIPFLHARKFRSIRRKSPMAIATMMTLFQLYIYLEAPKTFRRTADATLLQQTSHVVASSSSMKVRPAGEPNLLCMFFEASACDLRSCT